MTKHVQHHPGGFVTLSADFICAMAMFGEWKQAEAAPRKVTASKPVKAKPTNWKKANAKRKPANQ